MSNETMDRRHLLNRAGLVAGGAVLATVVAATPASASHNDGNGEALYGGWLLDRRDTVGTARGVITFGAGGTVLYQDIVPASPTLLQGGWAGAGRTFRFDMWGGSAANAAAGTPAVIVRISGTVSVSRRTFTSPYVARWLDPASNAEIFRFEGVATATRIEP